MTLKTSSTLKEVLKQGQSIWYDGLISRAEFTRMIEQDGIRGATTNPVIFEKALQSGDYDGDLKAMAAKGINADEIYKSLAIKAVQDVCDVFLPLYKETQGRDGFVSIEVNPHLAFDTEGTIKEAKELHQRVARPNAMIKIPATAKGIPAIQAVIAEGINVNVTLIFSVMRYEEVMEAYMNGLAARVAAGKPVKDIASVASFFVSRVDVAIDKILEDKIKATTDKLQLELYRSLLGQAAIANSKVAYAQFEKLFSEDTFRSLKSAGAQLQRPLWASTGTKNPAYRDVLYVETLIGPNTVNTIPPPTLDAFRDHGVVDATLTEDLAGAEKVLEKVAFCGISLVQVTEDLEKNGVQLFNDAYDKIIVRLKEKMKG